MFDIVSDVVLRISAGMDRNRTSACRVGRDSLERKIGGFDLTAKARIQDANGRRRFRVPDGKCFKEVGPLGRGDLSVVHRGLLETESRSAVCQSPDVFASNARGSL